MRKVRAGRRRVGSRHLFSERGRPRYIKRRRGSVLFGLVALLVVFGLLSAGSPTADAYSVSYYSELTAVPTTGGGGRTYDDCASGTSGQYIYQFGSYWQSDFASGTLNRPYAYCTTFNQTALTWGAYVRTMGGTSSWGSMNPSWDLGSASCASTEALVGLVVKAIRGYASGVQDHLWHAAIGLANSYPGCWKQHIGGILRWELFHRDHDCVSREYGGDWSRCLCRRYCGPTRPPLRHHLGCSSGDDLDDFVGIGDLGYELHPDIFWWQCGGDYLFKGFWFVHDFRLDDVAHRCRNLCRQSNESR